MDKETMVAIYKAHIAYQGARAEYRKRMDHKTALAVHQASTVLRDLLWTNVPGIINLMIETGQLNDVDLKDTKTISIHEPISNAKQPRKK